MLPKEAVLLSLGATEIRLAPGLAFDAAIAAFDPMHRVWDDVDCYRDIGFVPEIEFSGHCTIDCGPST